MLLFLQLHVNWLIEKTYRSKIYFGNNNIILRRLIGGLGYIRPLLSEMVYDKIKRVVEQR